VPKAKSLTNPREKRPPQPFVVAKSLVGSGKNLDCRNSTWTISLEGSEADDISDGQKVVLVVLRVCLLAS
jgi:hypothetical protein